ncbi:MAG: right-handed parallel beta-helix repeat-containing protein [Actinomycetes bacterium]
MKLLCSPRKSVFTFAILALVVAAVMGVPVSQAHATDLFVSVLGVDAPGPGPFATVPYAIGVASSGDRIIVGTGTFTGDIVLKSGVSLFGNGSVETILAGTGTSPVISAIDVTGDPTIDGFTIRGGSSSTGGGIYCSNSSPTITNCVISNNTGAGIYCASSSRPTIGHSIITANSGAGVYYENFSAGRIDYSLISNNTGAGIFCANSSPSIAYNTVLLNQRGGISCTDSSSPEITSNTINQNTNSTYGGGGIYCLNSSPSITYNSISNNTDNAQISGGGGIYCSASSPTIANNTITGNIASNYGGGGILCSNSSRPSISSNAITDNSASGYGAGILCSNSSPVITDNDILRNTSSNSGGGGIACSKSSPTIAYNTISGNTASNYGGGGILCYDSSSPTINGNAVSGNTATNYGGGGICFYDLSSPIITNNTISTNAAPASNFGGGGIYCGQNTVPLIVNNTITLNSAVRGGGIYQKDSSSQPAIFNCIVWENSDNQGTLGDIYPTTVVATYSDIGGGYPAGGTGNISVAPSFVSTSTSNFHLGVGSPCIDAATAAGAPNHDKDGANRPFGAGYDIGAYEWGASTTTYTLTYAWGASGTVTGFNPQTVTYGGSGTPVTAVPNTGYHFVSWSDGSTQNPRTDVGATGNVNVTATFAANTYTLRYAAGANGTILSGTTSQTVSWSGSGTAVEATGNAQYHFVRWSDGSTQNPRTDSNVKANVNVTAIFAPNTYALKYAAGANGTLSGDTSQTVTYPGSGTAVTAVPNTGYHFVDWSDGSTQNPRTDTVVANVNVTANFSPNIYRLAFVTDGSPGSSVTSSTQTVAYGGSSSPVTATAGIGYHFVTWTGTGGFTPTLANPVTVLNVAADATLTASFAINAYTLNYSAGTNGTLSGVTSQTVTYLGSGTAVTAVANTGYHFVDWSDGSTQNPRTDTAVAADVNAIANFAINSYTLRYVAGANGTLSGVTSQTVNYGGSATPVTANPSGGYRFAGWSDGSTQNPRIDINVTAGKDVTATFALRGIPIFVEKWGSDTTGDGTIGNPYATVPHAIAVAVSGDDILVGIGIFSATSDGSIAMKDGVSLYGSGSADTILQGASPVISAVNVTSSTTISGFTITGGSSPTGGGIYLSNSSPAITSCIVAVNTGAGIYCSNSSSPNITYSIISGNTGAGIYCTGASSPSITYNVIEKNISSGIYCASSSPLIAYNVVSANERGGISCNVSSSPAITSNTITNNTNSSYGGGGIYCANSTPTITGNAIINNGSTALNYGGGGIYLTASSPTITKNAITNNTALNYGGAGILCANSSSSTILSNAITDNSTAGGYGAGILCSNSSPTITDNDILRNKATNSGGGGIACSKSSPTISANTIVDNTATNYGGGGILCFDSSSPTINANSISGNKATNYGGGGICCYALSSPAITNNTISANEAPGSSWGGGGIYCGQSAAPSIINNTIVGNKAVNGGGIYALTLPKPSIVNCIVYDNADDLYGCAATYSNIGTSSDTSGTGNISAPPNFIPNSDFHLAYDSPCINVATGTVAPSTDKDGVTRPYGGGYDMGAYECVAVAPLTLRYAATAGGTLKALNGVDPAIAYQTVEYGGSGVPVLAKPDDFYHFVGWSDGRTLNPRTDANVTADVNATAIFALDTCVLTYNAGFGGTISGTTPQTIDRGSDGLPVTAVPLPGYRFVSWSDGSTENPRTDTNVTTSINVTATFRNTFTLTYAAGSNGSLSGDTSQTVSNGGSGTPVTANAAPGYIFARWSDGSMANPRTDTNVVADVNVTAIFGHPGVHPDIFVERWGSDTTGNGSPGSPYATVPYAIGTAVSGDTVHVGVGTFSGNITMKDGVSLYGSGPLSTTLTGIDTAPIITAIGIVQETTIARLKVTGGSRGIECFGTTSLVITGNSITGTKGTIMGDVTYGGQGIYCSNSSPTITYNTISETDGDATGIKCFYSTPTINYNTITGANTSGIICFGSSPTISFNTITGNAAAVGGGGGILCEENSSPTITDNSITKNTAEEGYGGGIYCSNSSPTIGHNVIDGNTASSFGGGGIYCDGSSPTITKNTISNNAGGRYGGGAILCTNSSSTEATITDNTIMGNKADGYGGGIYCSSASPAITDNAISNNTASEFGGGGIACSKASPSIVSNTIADNTASHYGGGGILCYDSSSPTINANGITGNTAANYGGGGICAYDSSSPTITNNIISGNQAPDTAWGGGGIYSGQGSKLSIINNTITQNTAVRGGGIFAMDSSNLPTITNCIVWWNGGADFQDHPADLYGCTATYSNISDSIIDSKQGNMSLPPSFVSTDTGPTQDLRLNGNSPCIITGTNTSVAFPASAHDKDGALRPNPNGNAWGLGAYQYYGMPVYRFYNPKKAVHFYTADPAEKADVITHLSSVYQYEGVAYVVNTGNPANNQPLWRFYNFKQGVHFYTASDSEKANTIANLSATYRFEGEAYKVSTSPPSGSQTVWRFFNRKQGVHFYTASPEEKDNTILKLSATYWYEGPAFYLAP